MFGARAWKATARATAAGRPAALPRWQRALSAAARWQRALSAAAPQAQQQWSRRGWLTLAGGAALCALGVQQLLAEAEQPQPPEQHAAQQLQPEQQGAKQPPAEQQGVPQPEQEGAESPAEHAVQQPQPEQGAQQTQPEQQAAQQTQPEQQAAQQTQPEQQGVKQPPEQVQPSPPPPPPQKVEAAPPKAAVVAVAEKEEAPSARVETLVRTLLAGELSGSVELEKFDVVYQACSFAANSPSEDTFQIRAHSKAGGLLAGVFDGHSGTAASVFCRDHLFDYIDKAAEQPITPDSWLQRLFPEPSLAYIPYDMAFLAADEFFLDSLASAGLWEEGKAGACAMVAHVRGDEIAFINAGDCFGGVGVMDQMYGLGARWAISVPEIHPSPENESEVERLVHQHPNEPDVVKNGRVKGRLQPSRGIGDGPYKRNDYADHWPPAKKFRETTGWTPPYTSAHPEFDNGKLEDNHRFVILTTDGLTDAMQPHMAVQYAGAFVDHVGTPAPQSCLTFDEEDDRLPAVIAPNWSLAAARAQRAPNELPNVATFLVERALLHSAYRVAKKAMPATADTMTGPQLLDIIAALPPHMRRRVYDDITVVVLLLRPKKK